ncbi:unnamed protein product [Ilex paraguariensis]|uniref:Uncharacterized protein n=1 Tax=Ilex paraguariensis TaxID=185542 RepID=A0ABC8SC90_9AQUA
MICQFTEFSIFHCRALVSWSGTRISRRDEGEGADSKGTSPFALSSNSSTGRRSVRNLKSKLASGPSKRGPGHV